MAALGTGDHENEAQYVRAYVGALFIVEEVRAIRQLLTAQET